jgi:hypothetical protein
MILLRFIVLCIVLFAGPASAGDESQKYARENAILEEELSLARTPQIYFVFNLEEKTTAIKTHGVLLRELPIKDLGYWGSPVAGKAYHVQKISTLWQPSRETIRPGEKKDDFKIDALELADMPSRYAVLFDAGLQISIRPETTGMFSGIYHLFSSSIRFLTRPFAMLWNALWGKPYTAIDIVLGTTDDARALYWSLSEGAGAIVYPP